MSLLVLSLIFGSFAVITFIRNSVVFSYRTSLLGEISTAVGIDMNNGMWDSEWRYDMYDEVSYDEMMFKFWKRCDSFYPERDKMVTPRVKV